MNAIDYTVFLGTILTIAIYGAWRTRDRNTLNTYLRGQGKTRWFGVGLSVMATQASAVTFLSTPGQGYASGLGFVQVYFGMPIALVIIAAVFVPIYRRLNVFTAYEYLGVRFDRKTRVLGTAVFLLQRGFGAGMTLYAPAIVLSTVMHWRMDLTIIGSGLVVIAYTTFGGTDAVSYTQKQQIAIIFTGMFCAVGVLWSKLPTDLTVTDTLTLAGGFDKLQAVDYSFDPQNRYTFWSGVLGATFLMLAYFGADQSQVQRYITSESVRESRLGLMFNALFKIPMQLFILGLGVLLFVFYLFEPPPVYFNQVAWKVERLEAEKSGTVERFQSLDEEFAREHQLQRRRLDAWLKARHAGAADTEAESKAAAVAGQERLTDLRRQANILVNENRVVETNEADYVFITFVLEQLPHGLIGLLIATFISAALSAKAAELNALASTTTIDVYRHLVDPKANDRRTLRMSKLFTAMWGVISIVFALTLGLAENLIQAVNIVGSIFYPVMLGLFLVGFFLPRVGGPAAFGGGLISQLLILGHFGWTHFQPNLAEQFPNLSLPKLEFSYLWYNLIGSVLCLVLSSLIQLSVYISSKRKLS